MRGAPMAQRLEFDIHRRQGVHQALGGTVRRRCPVLTAALAADTKCHERCAIVQVDTDPVPAGSGFAEVVVGPFVIQPRQPGYRTSTRASENMTTHGKVRKTIVTARLARQRTLTAEALLSLQQHCLSRFEFESEVKCAGSNTRAVLRSFEQQGPVVDMHVGSAFCCLR